MMTRLSKLTEFPTGSAERIERRVALARGIVGIERIWPALWPATAVAGLFIALALFGAFTALAWPLHALLLAAFIAATGPLLYLGLREIRLPDWTDGARRLERDSGLKHRPISEATDAIYAGVGDALAEELWRAHLRQRLASILKLRLFRPRSALDEKDPRALRFAVLLVVAAGLVFAGRDSLSRLMAAFSSMGASGTATMDAWIDPPPYTGEAPIFLRAGASPLAVPTGSLLNLRVHGAGHTPGLSMSGDHPGFSGENGEYASTVKITEDGTVSVRASGETLGRWSFNAIPDLPPHIAFDGAPGKTEHGALKLSFTAGDDYGVVSVRAIIRPRNRPGPPLIVDLPLAETSGKSIKSTAYRDLTEHPYAGLQVDIVLEATDAIGQHGRSKSMPFTLPARVFTNPLARALIEQRQNLASGNAVSRDRVLLTLDALTIAPDRFYEGQSGVYMGLRAAYWGLKNAHHEEDVQHVEALLWQIAIAIEQGGLAVAAEELRRLQAMITQALAQGAPQEVIDALLQRYQDALQRYMQSLAQNAPNSNQPIPPGAKVLSEKDLNALLNAIQQLAKSGNRAEAAQLLALLQSLLENLHMTTAGGAGGAGAPQDKALSDAIQGLGDLMGKQRGLMDKTFRDHQQGKNEGGALSQEQNQLKQQLGKVLGGLKGRKNAPPQDLGDADREMGESQNALSGNDLSSSSESQKEVLDSLRKGAGALAKEMMEEQQGQEAGRDQGEDQDPLGRAQGSNGTLGSGVKLPSQTELQRARSILEELRRRAAERGRPKEELDYIDRLLKEF